MTEQDAIELAQDAGWERGAAAAPYSPPISWGICQSADDAFTSAYFRSLALSHPIVGDVNA